MQASPLIQPRDAEALKKVQKLVLKFMKGLWKVPYEAALQRDFDLTFPGIHLGRFEPTSPYW